MKERCAGRENSAVHHFHLALRPAREGVTARVPGEAGPWHLLSPPWAKGAGVKEGAGLREPPWEAPQKPPVLAWVSCLPTGRDVQGWTGQKENAVKGITSARKAV